MPEKLALGFLVLLQNARFALVTDQLYSPSGFDHRPLKERTRNPDGNSRRSFGLYNVQTGDEFYMSDFALRPKLKTKYNIDAHKIDFEYSPNGFAPSKNEAKPPPPPLANNCTKHQQDAKKKTGHKNKKKQVNRPNDKNKKRPVAANVRNRRCVRKKPNGVKVIVACSNRSNNKNNAQSPANRNRICNKTRKGCPPTKTRVVATKNQKRQVVRGKQGNRGKTKIAPVRGSSKTVQNHAKLKAVPEANKGHVEIVSDAIKKYLTRLKQKFYGIRGGKTMPEGAAISIGRSDVENRSVQLSNNLLSLFTVIQLHNFKCVASSDSGNYDGKCYHPSQCKKLGATALGECVNGFGICCAFIDTCGGVSGQNCSYFQSPGYPSFFPAIGSATVTEDETTVDPRLMGTTEREEFTEVPIEDDSSGQTTEASVPDPRNKYKEYQLSRDGDVADALACSYRVYKISSDIQQMRVDLIDLELAGPTDGECVEEKLLITGQNLNAPIAALCGYNSGQHVYVDVTSLNGPLQVSVLADAVNTKRYKIRVCQFSSPCSNSMNCLQYHTGVQGVISSFNYDGEVTSSRSNPEYLNNLNYAICIRREAGYCSVTYDNVDVKDQEYPLELLNIDVDDRITVADGQAGMGLDQCPDDYVVINNIRFCGEDFNGPITDANAGPIVIPVRTNNEITGRGFKLFYTQNKCPT